MPVNGNRVAEITAVIGRWNGPPECTSRLSSDHSNAFEGATFGSYRRLGRARLQSCRQCAGNCFALRREVGASPEEWIDFIRRIQA